MPSTLPPVPDDPRRSKHPHLQPAVAPVPPHHAMYYFSAMPPPPKRTATTDTSEHRLTSAPQQRRRRKKGGCGGGARRDARPIESSKTEKAAKHSASSPLSTLIVAVGLWYSLGVISISTSKVLLTPPAESPNGFHHKDYYQHVGGIPPLALTLQQLLIGSILLSIILERSNSVEPWFRFGSESVSVIENNDSVSIPDASKPAGNVNILQPGTWIDVVSMVLGMESDSGNRRRNRRARRPNVDDALVRPYRLVVAAAAAFCLGFSTTNCAFGGASAAFVETIKAAEPITSAFLAVYYRLDVLNSPYEIASLGSIVAGVVLSTMGNAHAPSQDLSADDSSSYVWASAVSCAIVMTTNLCFSVRGILQKMYRGIPTDYRVDDRNWQMRMQQLGTYLLVIPVCLWDGPRILRHLWNVSFNVGLWNSGVVWRYICLSLINGIAFTSYNLASTFLLSRISVVHHAALNCLRRIFAIVVTSIVFRIPITMTGVFGIMVSLGGFLSFTYLKSQRSSGSSKRGYERSPSSVSANGDAKAMAQP